jgi:hypothetical protein
MLKNELKVALAVLGTVFVPVFAQADQGMNSSMGSSQQMQKPGLVPGDIIADGQVVPAYPQSAALVCDNGWDIHIGADYLYWKWSQDGSMGAGELVDQTSVPGLIGTTTLVYNNPGYTSGFKVNASLGLPEFDNWDLFAEYTWYKNTNKVSATGTAAKALVVAGLIEDATAFSVGTMTSEAKLSYQTLDFMARRAMYFGKQLTFNVGTGLRAQWITEHFDRSGSLVALASDEPAYSSVSRELTSWQLGPKLSMDFNWLLGAGFSINGKLHNSLLYTSYRSSNSVAGTLGAASFTGSRTGLDNYGTVRPVTEALLALAWGMYFCDNNFHFDLALGYDFNVYWNYDLLNVSNPGDMTLQGLNARIGFDF